VADAPLTRADAERILAHYRCKIVCWDDAPDTYVQLKNGSESWLPVEMLRALDPDRPPSLAAVRRILRGFDCDVEYTEVLDLDDANANVVLARAWALGAEDGDG
jgi:hypothetical protein